MTDASHPAVDRVADALASHRLSPEIVSFDDAVTTAPLAAAALGIEVGQIANSLVFTSDDEPILVLTSGAHRVDTEWLGAELGGVIEVPLKETVKHATGQVIGGVAPVGHPAPGAHDRRHRPRAVSRGVGGRRPREDRVTHIVRRARAHHGRRSARGRALPRSRHPRDLGSRRLAAHHRPARAATAHQRRPRPGALVARTARRDPLAAAHHGRSREVPHGVARKRRRSRPAHRRGPLRRGRRRHRVARRARRHRPVRRRCLARGRGVARLRDRSGARGRGYATAIARALLEIAFADLGLRRVTAECFADNVASWRVMERLGMRREQHGVRDSWHAELGWVDGYTYAMLVEEFSPAP